MVISYWFDASKLLDRPQFVALLSHGRQVFDFIIIDTPPILAVSDTILIAGVSDALIYVVKAEDTKEQQIKAGLKRLKTSGVQISGVVLNQVDMDKAISHQAFEGYYDQYGYNEDSQQVLDSQTPVESISDEPSKAN